jgi:SAM-dependent methyltransferase
MEPAADLSRALVDGHRRARPAVDALLASHDRAPAVLVARRRWSDLLPGSADDLFVDHTLLVVTAALVAHAAAGLPLDRPAHALLSGDDLAAAHIHGVVDRDCFSRWLLAVPRGDALVLAAAERLAALEFTAVDHDVLGRLYAAAIAGPARKRLGEHYTPDWLAARVVDELLPAARVLDPSCGSGTFLFHAVRRSPDADILGLDLHPVAVALARVTYLLALGRDRLHRRRDALHVPVHLGDALRPQPLPPADVLLGNPPWLAYRFMPAATQRTFARESRARGLWHGARLATHQDLSALFVVRAIDLYLRPGGRFGFVMPAAVLDRGQYAGFRRGEYPGPDAPLRLAFDRPWDLRRIRPHFFPISAGVVFGRRADLPAPMPPPAIFTGRLAPDATPEQARAALTFIKNTADSPPADSPYRREFLQGASIVPRVLFMVEAAVTAAARIPVRSARSAAEKPPWRDLLSLAGAVEPPFLHKIHLGETVLPYRLLAPRLAVLPCDARGLLAPDSRDHPGLAEWWQRAESAWMTHRASDNLTLRQQLDYHGKLSGQLPPRTPRVVYSKSGLHLAAAWFDDPRILVDHKLYWSPARSEDEARYLCAILNAAVTTARVRPLMSYGKDERDIDKFVWRLPIPRYDESDPDHRRLAALAREVEATIAALTLPTDSHFTTLRRRVRDALAASAPGRAIEQSVTRLLASCSD